MEVKVRMSHNSSGGIRHSQDPSLSKFAILGSSNIKTIKETKKSLELISRRNIDNQAVIADQAKHLRHSAQSLPKSYRGERPP